MPKCANVFYNYFTLRRQSLEKINKIKFISTFDSNPINKNIIAGNFIILIKKKLINSDYLK